MGDGGTLEADGSLAPRVAALHRNLGPGWEPGLQEDAGPASAQKTSCMPKK